MVKIPRFLSEIPAAMIVSANEFAFPLIEMPAHLSHPFVINEIHQALAKKQNELLLISEHQHNTMMNLLIQGGSYKEVCDMLHDSYNHSVFIVDDNCRDILACSLSDEDNDVSPHNLIDYLYKNSLFSKVLASHQSLIHKTSPDNYHLVIVPIQIKGINKGFLVTKCNDGLPSEQYLKSLEHATMTIALIVYNQRNINDVEARYCSEFLYDWFSGKILMEDTLQQRLKAIGWKISSDIGLLLISDPSKDISSNTSQKDLSKTYLQIESIKRIARKTIEQMGITHYAGDVGSDMVILVQLPQVSSPAKAIEILKSISQQLIENLDSLFPNQYCVFSGTYRKNPLEIKDSYEEAKKAVKIKQTYLQDRRILFFGDLGIFSLINSIQNDEAIRIVNKYYMPLFQHDSAYNTQYILTVRSYFECDCNMRKLAATLFIHYNTVCYRMQAISELLSINLNCSAHKTLLFIAVLIGCSWGNDFDKS